MTTSDATPKADYEVEADGATPAFAVTDEHSANWLVRKILDARSYQQRVKAWAEREVSRAEREEGFFLGRYGGQLEQWLRQHLSDAGRRQRSVHLPAGRVGLRAVGPRVIVEDKDAVIAWAKTHCPDAIEERTTVRIRKRCLDEHLEASGEMPEHGVSVRPAGDHLVIK